MGRQRMNQNLKSTEIIVESTGEVMKLGQLFKRQIIAFETWWKETYERLYRENKIIYNHLPIIELDNLVQEKNYRRLKFIATMNRDEFEAFYTEYQAKIEELSKVIPDQYKAWFYLEKNIKYINTSDCSLTISPAATLISKKATIQDIKVAINQKIGTLREGTEIKQEDIDQELSKLEEDKTYIFKKMTASKYQLNYYDIDQEKSLHTGLGDALFIPPIAILSMSKKQKKRADTKIPVAQILLPNAYFLIYENE